MAWDFNKNKPIYIQLIDIIKLQIVSGYLPIGSKLKSVRDMAADADVNPNTMQRALSELEGQGLVSSHRTSGRFVTNNGELIKSMGENIARGEIKSLIETLKSMGYSRDEIMKLIIDSIGEEK